MVVKGNGDQVNVSEGNAKFNGGRYVEGSTVSGRVIAEWNRRPETLDLAIRLHHGYALS